MTDGAELVPLVLELRHALQLSQRRDGVEDPGEVRVAGDLGLHEQRGLVHVDAARVQRGGEVQ